MPFPLISLESIPPLEPYLTNRRTHEGDYAAQLTFAAMLVERETYYMAMYTPWGQYGAEPPREHEAAWQSHPPTDEGRRTLAAARRLESGAGLQPIDLFGLKVEALNGLRATLHPRKSLLNGSLVAARLAIDLCRFDEAIVVIDAIERHAPDHPVAVTYRYEAMLGTGTTADVERRVRQRFGPRWSNTMTRARERHDLQIRRLAWRARTALEGERFTRFMKTERQWCEEAREHAQSGIDASSVPASLRALLPIAQRFGVGDDPCRTYFVSRATKAERTRALELVGPHLDIVQEWLDTFTPGSLPPEAAAFFWLLEALEEMRLPGSKRG